MIFNHKCCNSCEAELVREDFFIEPSLYCQVIDGEMVANHSVVSKCNKCGHFDRVITYTSVALCERYISEELFPSLSKRMNKLRGRFETILPKDSNILIMLDGCNFSKYTKRLTKPFDLGFVEDMQETCRFLAKNIPTCKMVYTQSDEISLYLSDKDTEGKQGWRDNRLSKLSSLVASMASSKFMQLRADRLVKDGKSVSDMDIAYFDSKVFVADEANDVRAWFLYRQNDCVRNSVAQFAQHYVSHKKLQNLKIDEVREMLRSEYNVDWDSLYDMLRYGRLFYKCVEILHKDNGETYCRNVLTHKDVLFRDDFSVLDDNIIE